MTSLIQRSLAAGEIGPELNARADQVKYQSGLAKCRNFRVMKHGGVENRHGLKYLGPVKDSNDATYFIPFIYNNDQTYVIEVGDLYFRFWRNGAQIVLSGVAAWSNATAYVVGDVVSRLGINYYCILAHTNQQPPNATYWYVIGGSIYEIPTPYAAADLAELQFFQSADVVRLVHNNYAPRVLSRTGHTSWILEAIDFDPETTRPSGVTGTVGAAGTRTYRYKVTNALAETYEESIAGLSSPQDISGITQANPGVLTYVGADNFLAGDEIYIANVVGMTQVNRLTLLCGTVTPGANTIALKNLDGSDFNTTGLTAYASGGTIRRANLTLANAAAPAIGAPNVISWNSQSNIAERYIYREHPADSGLYGYIGTSKTLTFSDTGEFVPDVSSTPPNSRKPFDGSDNYPACGTFYQQRAVYGNKPSNVERIEASRTGMFDNFTISSPLRDDDAVSFIVAGKKVQPVRHLIDLGKLVILTASGEWVSHGDVNGVLLATQPPDLEQIGQNGSSTVPPIIIDNSIIYIQARGNVVRDLRNEVSADGKSGGYNGRDLSVFAPHLFEGFTITRWTYQQVPHSTIWAVRSDGKLLGLTYLREHEIWGWHIHDTNGIIEDVVAVPEGDEDAVYVSVQRVIDNGTQTLRNIERFNTRFITDIRDFTFLDSYSTYNGWEVATNAVTLTSAGGGWTVSDLITATASTANFDAAEVGNALDIEDEDNDGVVHSVRINITEFVSTTVVRGYPEKTVPEFLRNNSTLDWSIAVDELSGLTQLEGMQVSIFADGNVIANPNNPELDVFTVVSGSLSPSLPRPYSIIHVGLPYNCDIETLDMDIQGEQIRDKRKITTAVDLLIKDTRGLFVGPEAPDDEGVDGLNENLANQVEQYDDTWPTQTGKVEIPIQSTWNGTGKIFVRQTDPLPATILGVIPITGVGG